MATVSLKITFDTLYNALEFVRRVSGAVHCPCVRSGMVVYLVIEEKREKRIYEVSKILGGVAVPFPRGRKVRSYPKLPILQRKVGE